MAEYADKTVLLTGATGCVGRYVYPALVAAGYRVRCATRRPDAARADMPRRDWVYLDVENEDSVSSAVTGCDSALFLVHGMGERGDYSDREQRAADIFSRSASGAGLRRVVYLGGVLPSGPRVSKHLRSRWQTGEILRGRAEGVSVVELRAAMVVGVGSASWTMVRDLAARLPAMLLPRWLRNTSYPVFIDDVVAGLLAAIELSGVSSMCFDLPGPERIAHRDVLDRTAVALGHHRVMLSVPVLSPRLSSYWIGLVTRVDLALARELVEGVRYDLEPQGNSLWEAIGRAPTTLEHAIELVVADEICESIPSAGALVRLERIGRAHATGPTGRPHRPRAALS